MLLLFCEIIQIFFFNSFENFVYFKPMKREFFEFIKKKKKKNLNDEFIKKKKKKFVPRMKKKRKAYPII